MTDPKSAPGADGTPGSPDEQATMAWPSGSAPLQPESGVPVQERTIGPYRIIGLLGEGGMGEVYEAEQQNPRRRVALKVIRGRHNADEFHVKLFRREAESLGRLRHPGIAAVHESGHTEEGRHFFAMELVRGETLDEFCRGRDAVMTSGGALVGDRSSDAVGAAGAVPAPALTRGELEYRLKLFLKVCDAVNYAHQRGVIHRDLKPSNIMVPERSTSGSAAAGDTTATSTIDTSGESRAFRTPVGATDSSASSRLRLPEIKVLDFGLARISDPDGEAATVMTQAGSVRGTPAYMSPEQARGNSGEIDLRTDVYSLGVILYEMLTGIRPLDFKDASVLGAFRIICEREPTPLRRATAATARLDSDLETIVLKALAKDPEQRYTSAAAFAEDIERFLADEPVLASPPSATYRLRKLVKRHKVLFASLGVVAVALIAATIVSTAYYFRAERESARARTEAVRSEQVAAFLAEMLEGVGPAVARGQDTQLLREVLDNTAEKVGTSLGDQPAVEASLRSVLGLTYRELGEYETAEPHLIRARDLWSDQAGALDARTLEATVEIANLDYFLGRMEHADSLFAWAGDRLEATVGADDPRTLSARSGQALLLMYMGELDESAAIGERIVPVLRRQQGDSHEVTQAAMFNLAQTYADQLRDDDAETLFLELLDILRRECGPDHPRTLSAMSACGWSYRLAAKYEEAERFTGEALREMRRVLGNEHSETLIAVNNLAIIYKDLGRFDDAEPLYLENLESGIKVLGEKHPENLPSFVNIAAFYQAQDRWADAETMADRAVATFTDVMPPGHIGIAFARMTRGQCRLERGSLPDAEEDLLAAYAVLGEYFEPDHRHVQKLLRDLAKTYDAMGRTDEASTWRAKAITESG